MASPWDGLLGKKSEQLQMNPDPLLETATMGGYDPSAILADEKDPLARALYAQQLQAIEQQSRGIQDLEGMKRELASKKPEVDLSPVIAFTDYLSGAQASKMYQKPESADDLNALRFKLQNEIEKRKSGVTGDIADVLKSKLASKRAEQIALASGRQERFEQKRYDELEKELSKDLDKSFLAPSREKVQMFGQMEDQLAAGKYQDVMQSLSIFARQIGQEKGAMSEGDVGRQLAKTLDSDIAKLKQYFTGDSAADPKVIEQLKKTVEIAKNTTAKSYQKYLDDKEKQYSAQNRYQDLFIPGKYGQVGFEQARESIARLAPRGTSETVGLQPGTTRKGKGGITYQYVGGPENAPSSWKKVD